MKPGGKKDIMKKLFIENQQIGRYVQKDKTQKKIEYRYFVQKKNSGEFNIDCSAR